MNKLILIGGVALTLCGATHAETYWWNNGSGDFTDWGSSTVTADDEIRFWTTGVNAPWIDGREGIGVATNFLCKELSIYNPKGNTPSDNTLEVRQGGLLESESVKFLSYRSDPLDSIARLLLTGGSEARLGKLNIGGYRESDVNAEVVLEGGSKMTVSGNTSLCSSFSKDRAFRFSGAMRVVDSIYIANGQFNVGNSYEDASLLSAYFLSLAATNSVMTFASDLRSYHGKLSFKDCDLRFTGSSSNSGGNWQPGSMLRLARGSEAVFDGGAVSNAVLVVGCDEQYGSTGHAEAHFRNGRYDLRALAVGVAIDNSATAGDEGVVTIGEGATVTYPMDGVSFTVGFNAGSGTVHVVGGTLSVRPGADQIARIASRANGKYGCVKVSGGLWDHTKDVTYAINVGEVGEGHVYVSGGEARLPGLNFNSKTSVPSSYEQSGGLVTIRAKSDTAWNNAIIAQDTTVVKLTGGVLSAKTVKGTSTGDATFIADGGTLRPAAGLTGDLLHDFKTATCGPQGLTVDTDGLTVSMSQSLTDAAGEAGLLRKTGAGKLTVSSASVDVSNTVVDGGTLELGTGAFSTSLVVTNGATFSLAGAATSATLQGLAVADGTLKIDPNDKIVVTGKTTLRRLRVEFTTLPTADQAADFIVCEGELDADTLQALRRAVMANPLADGTHGSLTATYDAATGKTTVKIAVKTDVPLTDETAWTGSGAWSTAGNWTAGVPTAAKAALFGADATTTEVSVEADAVAGALRFADKDFTLTGASALAMPSEEGSLEIAVVSGTQTVDVPLRQDAVMALSVASDASVTLAKPIDGVGVRKTGSGKATLAADNVFCGTITANGGILSVASDAALGDPSGDAGNLVSLGDGTLEIAAGEGELALGQDVRIRTSATTKPTVVRNARDTVLSNGITVDQGCFIKRGAGRLTVGVKEGDVLTMSSDGVTGGSEHYDYPADGTPPEKLFTGVTVVEGEMLLKPAVAGTHPSVTLKSDLFCGVKTAVEAGVNPVLALEDVSVDAATKNWTIGRGCNDVLTEAMEPKLRMVNADLTLATLIVGTWAYNAASKPWVAFTNATVTTTSAIQLTTSNGPQSPVQCFGKDSSFFAAGGHYFGGGIRLDYDHCRVVGKDGAPTRFWCYSYSGNCTFDFRNGTEVGMGQLDFDDYGTSIAPKYQFANFTFDDSTWYVGENDITIDATTAYPGRLHFYSQGETGLTVRIASGHTLNFAQEPLAGSGGLVVTGGGTVKFGNGKLQASGTLVAEAGTIDLTDAGTVENAVIGAGAGVIKGGTFRNATITLGEIGTAVPNFENCTFAGTTRVMFAGEPGKASDVAVARFTGSLTGVETFALKGWQGYRGLFRKSGDTVKVDIGHSGMAVIVR